MDTPHTSDKNALGTVILLGAGPGDPELITLKAVRHLNRCDVILADRLINPGIMLTHAPQAQVIYVGKTGGSSNSTAQSSINELLVQYARAGYYVVRLKGGDSNIFSNIFDEITTLDEKGIPYECIPGISAVQGVASALAMPLTARNYARGIRLLTFFNQDLFNEITWQDLAHTDDTLVFYMSGRNYLELAAHLIYYGKSKNTPVLLAEQATTSLEQYRISTLEQCQHEWQEIEIASPALLIIGNVAALAHIRATHQKTRDIPAFAVKEWQSHIVQHFSSRYALQDKLN